MKENSRDYALRFPQADTPSIYKSFANNKRLGNHVASNPPRQTKLNRLLAQVQFLDLDGCALGRVLRGCRIEMRSIDPGWRRMEIRRV